MTETENPVPDFAVPVPRAGSAEVPVDATVVDNAVLTPFKVFYPGNPEHFRGAIYTDDGNLVSQSQRGFGPGQTQFVPDDPERLPNFGSEPRHLDGSWFYGGHWMNHFGHFIIEALPAIGLHRPGYAGLLFHRFIWNGEPSSWQRELLRLAGWDPSTPISIVGGEPGPQVTVERVSIERRPVVLGLVASKRAVEIWQEVARRASAEATAEIGHHPKVYFSRTHLNHDNRFTRNDRVLEDRMAERGFHVVHPQELPVAHQLALAANAEVIAGIAGSNLLLSAFAPAGTRIIEIGNRRNPVQGQHMQRALSAATGHLHVFLPYAGGRSARNVVPTLEAVDTLLKGK
ncbi:glycosyltransferase family 61 protein [Brevibacterium samyangense]|uniref:Glycosyltransferase 61 catalytic domain-containing protein n=1 Tax=Brevibacterium samyangense TaxID=366888 RepID=A0ABN2TNL1_9MICO